MPLPGLSFYWYCCQCTFGPLSCKIQDFCPSCFVQRCQSCTVEAHVDEPEKSVTPEPPATTTQARTARPHANDESSANFLDDHASHTELRETSVSLSNDYDNAVDHLERAASGPSSENTGMILVARAVMTPTETITVQTSSPTPKQSSVESISTITEWDLDYSPSQSPLSFTSQITDSHTFIRGKAKSLTNRIMRNVYFHFDVITGIITCGNGNTPTESHNGSYSTSAQGSSTQHGQEKRKRAEKDARGPGEDQDRGDDDDDDDDPNPQKNRQIGEPRLACPFFKHSPGRCTLHKSCYRCGFPSIHRVKEHIYRCHRVYPCPRCWVVFIDVEALNAHQRKSDPCSLAEERFIFGVDDAKVAKMKCKKRDSQYVTRTGQWRRIYLLIFPATAESDIPDPFFTPGKCSVGEPCDSSHQLLEHLRCELSKKICEDIESEVLAQIQMPGSGKPRQINVSFLDIQKKVQESFDYVVSTFNMARAAKEPPQFEDNAIKGSFSGSSLQQYSPSRQHVSDRDEDTAIDFASQEFQATNQDPSAQMNPFKSSELYDTLLMPKDDAREPLHLGGLAFEWNYGKEGSADVQGSELLSSEDLLLDWDSNTLAQTFNDSCSAGETCSEGAQPLAELSGGSSSKCVDQPGSAVSDVSFSPKTVNREEVASLRRSPRHR